MGSLLTDDEVSGESFAGIFWCCLMFSFHLKILDETVFSCLVGGGEMLEVGVSLSPWILLEKVLGGFTGGIFPAGKNKKHRQTGNYGSYDGAETPPK